MADQLVQALLSDIEALSLVPNFLRAIFHKVEELKELLYDDIDSYREVIKKIVPIQPGSYKLKKQSGKWVGQSWWHDKLLQIVINSARPGIPAIIPFHFKGRHYLVSIERDGDTITGKIEIKESKNAETHSTVKSLPPDDITEHINAMLSNEVYRQHVIQAFKVKWRPLIDSEAI